MPLVKKLLDSELKIIAGIIRDHIFVPSYEKKITIFLCGADRSDKKTGRYKIAKLLGEHPKFELLYPEDIFSDLLTGQGQHSLLSLENILASSVDAIILLPESPGSFAELGAFSNDNRLVNKLICIGQKKFSKKKSFINYGPVRLLKASDSGKSLNIIYDDLNLDDKKHKIYKTLNDSITVIRKKNPIKRDVANILETENFILPCIYLIDNITSKELYKLVEFATDMDAKIAEIATRSAISRLIKKRFITRTTTGYAVTKNGTVITLNSLSTRYLDTARLEIISSQKRRKTTITKHPFEWAYL